MKVLGVVLSEDLSAATHIYGVLESCSRSLYALPETALHEVARATILARLLYASPAWWGFASVSDRTRVERFLQRTIRMGYFPPALPDAAVLVAEAKTRLLASVALRPHHVLRPLFPPVIIRHPGLRSRPRDFILPEQGRL